MNKTEHIKKKAVIEALIKSLGVVTTACKIVGIGRTTFYDWLKDDKNFKKEVEDIQNVAIDFAESELFKQIQSGNTTIFYLKCKGKKRGFYEKQQIDMTTDDEPIKININLNGRNNT